MKKLIFLLVALPLYGCESMGRHFQQLSECNRFVDSKIPPKYTNVYVRTDTSCSSSGSVSPTTTRGDGYLTNGVTNCISTPVYQTVEANSLERNALRNECMAAKKASYIAQKNLEANFSNRNQDSQSKVRSGDVMSVNDAKSICESKGLKDSEYISCVLKTVRGQ